MTHAISEEQSIRTAAAFALAVEELLQTLPLITKAENVPFQTAASATAALLRHLSERFPIDQTAAIIGGMAAGLGSIVGQAGQGPTMAGLSIVSAGFVSGANDAANFLAPKGNA